MKVKELETLWDFQNGSVNAALDALQKGKNVLIQSPTGSGKTAMFVHIIHRFAPRKRVLVMAPTDRTCRQPLRYRWIAERGGRDNWQAQIVLTTPQGALANLDKILEAGPIALVVPDECHRAVARVAYTVIVRLKKQGALCVGVTATPDRADKRYLDGVFDVTHVAITVEEAIKRGFIARPRVRSFLTSDGKSIVGTKDEIATVCYWWWKETGGRSQTILFTSTIAGAEAYAAYLNRHSIKAAAIHSQLSQAEQWRLLDEYEAGRIMVLTNAGVLTEGADFPMTRCVVIAATMNSRRVFSQAVGRGTRIGPNGEAEGLVLDFTWSENHSLLPEHDGFGVRPPSVDDKKREERWQRQRNMSPREALLDDAEEIRRRHGW